jgi:hypothetical protein
MSNSQRKVNECRTKYQGKRKCKRNKHLIESNKRLHTGKTIFTFLWMSGILDAELR